MAADADSIDDMNILRHGGMPNLFDHVYAPSTLGAILRSFTFGYVRTTRRGLDSSPTTLLNQQTPLLTISPVSKQSSLLFVDIDDTVIDVHIARK